MALTALVKDELARYETSKASVRKAEISTILRFTGGLHIVSGRIVVEAEVDSEQTALRMQQTIAEIYGHEAEITSVNGGGLRRGGRYIVRVDAGGEALARQTGLLDLRGRPVRGLPPVTDPVEQLEREALAVIIQFPVAAHRAGADELGADSFGQLTHRAVYEAVAAAGGTGEVPGLVQQAVAAGMGEQEAQRRATLRWLQQVRDGAIGLVEAAITELAVAPLPLPTIRGRGTEVDALGLDRYAKGVLSSLAIMGINRQLVEMRSRHRRMSPQDEGYRELFSQIAALEQRRMQIRQGA